MDKKKTIEFTYDYEGTYQRGIKAPMSNQEFLKYFSNMEPMKYYEADASHNKAKEMINNKDDKFIAMEKRDGEWCRAIIHEDGVLLQSRSVSKVTGTYGDKTELVPHIVQELKNSYPSGTVLLGELAFIDYNTTSKDVGTILRCKAPKAIERQKENPLFFFPFDMLAYNYNDYVDMDFEERYFRLEETINPDRKYIHKIKDADCHQNFMDFADFIWWAGGEGIVIMRKDAPYQPGKRTSWMSLKVKKKLGDLDAQVIGFIEPNKAYEGTELENWKYFIDENGNPADLTKMIDYGTLTPVTKPYYYGWKNGVIVNYNGKEIRVTSGLTDRDREWLASDEADYMLSRGELIAIITGMEMTEDSIRHPILKGLKENK
jgi:ATP-dependent DNA ligase